MNVRLLPWAVFALIVLLLAIRGVPSGKAPGIPPAAGTAPAQGIAAGGPEIRLGPVEMREYHDDGWWNLLTARTAVYSYSGKTVGASDVVISLGERAVVKGGRIEAPEAFWNLDRKTIELPEGGRAVREGGWDAELSRAFLDLPDRILRVPGPASLAGPGFAIAGNHLVWHWGEGRVTMESPRSRILPAGLRPGGARG